MQRPSRYVHGSEPAEQERLAKMNRLLNERHLAALAPCAGARVLEAGAGTGVFALELARAVGPAGSVLAIERDERQLAFARALWSRDPAGARIEGRAGDLMSPPLSAAEWGSFELVHARFLLEHVPEPARLTAELVRAARPGGRIVLADDDHDVLRLHPEAPDLERVWRAYVATYTAHGNDPFVGRKLPALLAAAGAPPVRCEWLPFGACAGEPLFPVVVENLRGILLGAREAIEAQLGAPRAFERGLAELDAWAREPGAAFWYALCWAEGRKPGG